MTSPLLLVFLKEQCDGIGLTIAAANVRIEFLAFRFQARRLDDQLAAKAQETLDDETAQNQVLASICSENAGHRTSPAYIGLPGLALGIRGSQAAFLLIAAPIKIGVVIFTFLAKGCAHALIIQYTEQRP